MKQFKVSNINELDEVAPQLWNLIKDNTIILFKGSMGAGKTTLISSILKYAEVTDAVSSPTYSIVNEYHDSKGHIYYHFDFYRIKNLEEAINIGVEDYLYSGNYCFIEWAEKIEQLIPDNFISVNIESEGNIRYISISNPNTE
jgi:tRNA threonylcarbamoyladenosine biosynthesis protein TsaE